MAAPRSSVGSWESWIRRTLAKKLRASKAIVSFIDLLGGMPKRKRDHAAFLLRSQQRLDRAAFVHRTVAFRHVVQGQAQVEYLAGVDLTVPH